MFLKISEENMKFSVVLLPPGCYRVIISGTGYQALCYRSHQEDLELS